MTILEALKGISNYPVPQRTINRFAVGRGLALTQEITKELMDSRDYRFAEADMMIWLAAAPNISEGGVSFSFSQAERTQLKAEGESILAELGAPKRSIYGYKGENL